MMNAIKDLAHFFKKHNIKYALIGGSAINYYNVTRITQDFDFVTTVDVYNLDSFVHLICDELKPLSCNPHHSIVTIRLKGVNVDIIPYFTNEELRALNGAKYRDFMGTKCRIARIEDILLLKLSISDTEDRHLKDVEFICSKCKKFIDIKYLKEGIIALNMQRHTSYLNNLLGCNINF